MAEPEQKQQPTLAEQYDVAPVPDPAADGVSGPATRSGSSLPAESRPPEAAPDERPRDPDTGRFVSPQTPPSPAPTHQHSPIVRRMARDLGWADDEIAATDPVVLSNLVLQAREERVQAQRGRSVDNALNAEANRFAAEERLQPQRPAAEDDGPDPGELGLAGTRNDWDPSLLKLVKSLREEINELKGYRQRQEHQTLRQQAEAIFAADYAEFMGPEPGPDTPPDDPGLLKRQVLTANMGRLAKGSLKAQIQAGMEKLFGQKPRGRRAAAPAPEPEPDDADEARRRWQEGALARPTHRAGAAEPKGYEKAVASVARAMRENGARDVPPPAISDEFPG